MVPPAGAHSSGVDYQHEAASTLISIRAGKRHGLAQAVVHHSVCVHKWDLQRAACISLCCLHAKNTESSSDHIKSAAFSRHRRGI